MSETYFAISTTSCEHCDEVVVLRFRERRDGYLAATCPNCAEDNVQAVVELPGD